MSKIYDALQRAQSEGFARVEQQPLSSLHITLPVQNQPSQADVDIEEEMIALYQTITSALPDVEHRSVLFVGSRSNEGTTTIARELAKTISLRTDKKVLLVDLDRSRPDLHVYGGVSLESNIDEIVKTGDSIEKAIFQVKESSLHVMPIFQEATVTPRTLDIVKGRGFWEPLKERFDLVIVDSPPATRFPDGPGIVSQVDGVILVVEAEKTRWQVALSVKEKIEKSGGRILGIVFNKRKFYIPGWLYKKL